MAAAVKRQCDLCRRLYQVHTAPYRGTPHRVTETGKSGSRRRKAAAPEQPQDTEPGTADAPEKPTTPETFYKVRQNSYSDSPENSYILQEYVAQDNGMAKLGDILYTGTPEKCRELLGKLETGELTQGDVKDLYAKAQEAQTAAEPGQDVPEQTADKKSRTKTLFHLPAKGRGRYAGLPF